MQMTAYEFRIRRQRRPKVADALARYGRIVGPEAAAAAFREITSGADREMFIVGALDAKGALIGYEIAAIGCLTGVEVHPREVFRGAIAAGACSVIVGHNHPSGDASPSGDDLALTRRLRAVGDVIGIPVLDHVVVSEDDHTSIAELIGAA